MSIFQVDLVRPAGPYSLLYPTNVARTAFKSAAPNLTGPYPTGSSADGNTLAAGYLEVGGRGAVATEFVELLPFGNGMNNQTFNMNVWGVSSTGPSIGTPGTAPAIWFYTLLASFTACTLDTTLVFPNTAILANTNNLIGAITQSKGTTNANDITVSSPATSGQAAFVRVRPFGHQYLFVDFQNVNTTSCNAFWRKN